MNLNIATKLAKALTALILLSCLAIFVLYLIQRYGAQYAEHKIQEQLEHSGLTSFVHYESIHFDPFTLTPSLENVRFGADSWPWLRFARISLNQYPIKYPDLDMDFWIQESPIASVSGDTRRWMRAAGIETLLGKGSFSSKAEGEKVLSQFKLDIKDVGEISLSSNINLLDQTINLPELRSDLLASFALGQPEAMLIMYGKAIELRSLDMTYQDAGLIHHLFPQPAILQESKQSQLDYLTFRSQALGLAAVDSKEAKQIASAIWAFLNKPEKLTLSLSPSSPINLKALALSASEERLYKDSNMTITND
ncbi:hypothetical protein A8139_06570 [Marinomonas primoryensis]|uniref:DUF2125 domain-containing protein n=1 Tax=Marinomonas primoryensis TaxID=178399 RepID=A0A2Z4PQ07_9GAMM|nr:hypothetical protein [Marinomonas primoryensis]AWX99700.1 hypothetical protein A8139_06570 [Marinomonas primoryensis]